jgi:hypothetical protein
VLGVDVLGRRMGPEEPSCVGRYAVTYQIQSISIPRYAELNARWRNYATHAQHGALSNLCSCTDCHATELIAMLPDRLPC